MEDNSLKGKTAKGFMWSSIGNSAQLVIGLIFGIYLARLLQPSDYGMIGLLQIFTLIATTLQDSGFRTTLINQKQIRHEDYNSVFWFNVFISITLYAILYFIAPYITLFYQQSDYASRYDLSELTPLARYIFLSFVISSIGAAHYAYLFRTMKIKQKSLITICSLLISNSLGIILAYNGYAYWGLATQTIVYTTCNTLMFWYFSGWRPTIPRTFSPLKKMFGFSSKVMISDILGHFNNNMLSVALGRFFSIADVGYFNQAQKWTSMGSSTLYGIVKDVTQPVLKDVSDEQERHKRVFRKMLRFTSFITFPAMFGLALISKELIVITITDKWIDSVSLMQVLCAGAFFYPIQHLCINLVLTKDRSDIIMWSTAILGISQLIAVLLSIPFGIFTTVCVYTSINVCSLIVWFYFVRREVGLLFKEAISDMFPYALIAGGVMIVTFFATAWINNVYFLLIAKIICAILIYTTSMWVTGSTIFKECINFLLKRNI